MKGSKSSHFSVPNFVTSGGVFSVLKSVEMCDQYRVTNFLPGELSVQVHQNYSPLVGHYVWAGFPRAFYSGRATSLGTSRKKCPHIFINIFKQRGTNEGKGNNTQTDNGTPRLSGEVAMC